MTRRYSTEDVLEVYEDHPASGKSIMERLERNGIGRGVVRELDLAIDPIDEITDQNHVGGPLSTLRLAAEARVERAHRVLDLGCGIGGPARLLAEIFRCTVHGIDASRKRIEDARELTKLVGLSDLASFESADLLAQPYRREFTVVWAQNTWIHIDQPERLARLAASALSDSGLIAFEDVCLRRSSRSVEEERRLSELGVVWRSSLTTADCWLRAFQDAGFGIASRSDDDDSLLRYFARLSSRARAMPHRYPPQEVLGWNLALDLAQAGLIGYVRIVGKLG